MHLAPPCLPHLLNHQTLSSGASCPPLHLYQLQEQEPQKETRVLNAWYDPQILSKYKTRLIRCEVTLLGLPAPVGARIPRSIWSTFVPKSWPHGVMISRVFLETFQGHFSVSREIWTREDNPNFLGGLHKAGLRQSAWANEPQVFFLSI
jgi:hypothetical protein